MKFNSKIYNLTDTPTIGGYRMFRKNILFPMTAFLLGFFNYGKQ